MKNEFSLSITLCMACTESDPWDMIQIWFWKTESTLQKIPIELIRDIFVNPDGYIMKSNQASSRSKNRLGVKRNNSSTPTLLTAGPPARKTMIELGKLYLNHRSLESDVNIRW